MRDKLSLRFGRVPFAPENGNVLRRDDSGSAKNGFCHRLVHAQRGCFRAASDDTRARKLEKPLHRAVLALSAVDDRKNNIVFQLLGFLAEHNQRI